MKLRVPHTFALLFGLIVLAAALTHVIPAGEYGRVERAGRQVVDAGSYRPVAGRPAGVGEVFLAWPRGSRPPPTSSSSSSWWRALSTW